MDVDQPRKRRKKHSRDEDLHAQISYLKEQLRLLRQALSKTENPDRQDAGRGPTLFSETPLNATGSVNGDGESNVSSSVPANGTGGTNNGHPGDVALPLFVLKFDLEKELKFLCDGTAVLSDITAEIKASADRRRELLKVHQDVVTLGIIGLQEAKERLDIYRTQLYAAHQLVEISGDISAETLMSTQPFLFNTIMSITCMVYPKAVDRDVSLKLENHAVECVVTEIMVAGTKTVELVKCLILLSLWYNLPEFFKLRRYHILNTVAVTLLHDLGIVSRPQYSYSSEGAAVVRSQDDCSSVEYRALIMILYFSTVSICLILRRTIFVKWTPYVNECCEMLEKEGISKYKELAMFLRLNHELERIHHIIHAPDVLDNKPKVSKYVLSEFQSNLAIIKSNLNSDDHYHRAYYYSVEAYLHQPVLSDIQVRPAGPHGCTLKLLTDTLNAIAHCTALCLFALDEFNQLLPVTIGGLPLFYCLRVIYTAGMLLRLRYLILSLPSHIEKELVPRYAIVAIQKLNKLVEVSSNMFPGNNFLKKMRLILVLFIQTYVTQVLEMLKKNNSTPTQFRPVSLFEELPKKELNEMTYLANILYKGQGEGLITSESGKSYAPSMHLDLLSYAASFRRDDGDKDDKKPSVSPLPETEDLKLPSTPQSSQRLLISGLVQQTPAPPLNGYPMAGNINTAIATLRLASFPNPPMEALVRPLGNGVDYPIPDLQHAYPANNLQQNGSSPVGDMPLDPFFNFNDEFWSHLLSTDSNKIHFTQSMPDHTDEVFYMS